MIKRDKTDKKVIEWEDEKSGFSTVIYLNGTKFVATLLEREFEAPDVGMLKRMLKDYATHWLEMEWFPIAKIKIEDASDRYNRTDKGEGVRFKRDRFYLSRSPVGDLWRSEWETEPEHRKANMDSYGRADNDRAIRLTSLPLGAPIKIKHGRYGDDNENEYLVDYTEELWDRLTGIEQNIAFLRQQLILMCSSKKGVAELLKLGQGVRIDSGALMLDDNRAK